MPTFPSHLCASRPADPSCSGMRPCEACYEALRTRVLARAVLYTAGPLTDRSTGLAQALFANYSRAMHEHVEQLSQEEAAYLQAHAAQPAPPPAQAAAAALPRLPCPASLGYKYPCLKPLGHCDHEGKPDKHVCQMPDGSQDSWDEPVDLAAAYAKYGLLPATDLERAAAEAQAAPQQGQGVVSEEEVAQQILSGESPAQKEVMRNMGYREGPDGKWIKDPPAPAPTQPAAPEGAVANGQTTPASAPAATPEAAPPTSGA